MIEAKTYLELSIDHLGAAEVLFQNKKFPQSIYFLQQSTEIALKSYGLYTKDFNEDELKKKPISHKSQNIYTKISRKAYQDFNESWKNIKVKFPHVNFDTLEFSEHINQVIKNENELIHLESAENSNPIEIDSILKQLEDCIENLCDKENLDPILNLNQTDYDENLEKTERFLSAFLDVEYTNFLSNYLKQISLDEFKSLMRTQYLFVAFTTISTQILFRLSTILFTHNEKTRYPNFRLNHNPLTTYNEEHHLIRNFNRIQRLITQAQYCLEHIYN